eukprot:Rhum_TRINITY_DN14938_c20_g1::Rhum_TRINITY_DN14938_c20_g1_i1::g.130246::m.130246
MGGCVRVCGGGKRREGTEIGDTETLGEGGWSGKGGRCVCAFACATSRVFCAHLRKGGLQLTEHCFAAEECAGGACADSAGIGLSGAFEVDFEGEQTPLVTTRRKTRHPIALLHTGPVVLHLTPLRIPDRRTQQHRACVQRHQHRLHPLRRRRHELVLLALPSLLRHPQLEGQLRPLEARTTLLLRRGWGGGQRRRRRRHGVQRDGERRRVEGGGGSGGGGVRHTGDDVPLVRREQVGQVLGNGVAQERELPAHAALHAEREGDELRRDRLHLREERRHLVLHHDVVEQHHLARFDGGALACLHAAAEALQEVGDLQEDSLRVALLAGEQKLHVAFAADECVDAAHLQTGDEGEGVARHTGHFDLLDAVLEVLHRQGVADVLVSRRYQRFARVVQVDPRVCQNGVHRETFVGVQLHQPVDEAVAVFADVARHHEGALPHLLQRGALVTRLKGTPTRHHRVEDGPARVHIRFEAVVRLLHHNLRCAVVRRADDRCEELELVRLLRARHDARKTEVGHLQNVSVGDQQVLGLQVAV